MKPEKGGLVKAVDYSLLPKAGGILDLAANNSNVDLIYDPYNKKYYGTYNYDQLASSVRGYQAEAYRRYMAATRPSIGMGSIGGGIAQSYNTMAGRVDPVAEATKSYEAAMASAFLPKKEDYIQSYDVINSYKAYGSDWDTYFKRSFQNPRVEEENRNKRARTEQAQQRNQILANNLQDLLVEASSMPSGKKVTNTGVSSRADVFSGRLEAGLGV